MAEEIHVGSDCTIEATIKENGSAVDISTATSKEIWILKPEESARDEYAASFSTDGTDGKVKYEVPNTYNDIAGVYSYEAEVVVARKTYRSSIDTYEVFDTI